MHVPRQPDSELSSWNTALLLIAHGSREEEANADLHFLVDKLHARGRYGAVQAAFLELAKPDIDEAAERCVSLGVARIILLPYFISPGIHVRRDLTEACRRLQARYPQVEFRLAEPLGRHPLLVEIVSERAQQAED